MRLKSICYATSTVLFFVCPSESYGSWAKTYSFYNYDFPHSIQQTSDGGYIVTGYTYSITSNADIFILKLDESGNVSWQKTYGDTTKSEGAQSIQQTSDGGYILAGFTEEISLQLDVWVLKLDTEGEVQWQKVYGSSEHERAQSIQQTSDGGYILAADCWHDGVGKIWLLKLDTEGGVQWQKVYGIQTFSESIQQTSDGGYIVAGHTEDLNIGYKILLLKLSDSGSIQWQKAYGGDQNASHSSIQQTSDGGYIVACQILSGNAHYSDVWVLKLSTQGTVQWQKAYGDIYTQDSGAIQQTSDGGYVVTGDIFLSYESLFDIWVLKLDTEGAVQWQKACGGNYQDIPAHSSGQQTSDGGYVVACQTMNSSQDERKILVLKLDNTGNIPDCEIVKDSNATTINTQASGINIGYDAVNTSATIRNTSVSAHNIIIDETIICFDDDDGIPDAEDNCPETYNPDQIDSYPPDGNGCGDVCECHADFDNNQTVNLADLVIMKQQFLWNCSEHASCEADCNYDGSVNLGDLVMMKNEFLRVDCPACP